VPPILPPARKNIQVAGWRWRLYFLFLAAFQLRGKIALLAQDTSKHDTLRGMLQKPSLFRGLNCAVSWNTIRFRCPVAVPNQPPEKVKWH
jgi:hypothetical protein